MLEHPGFKNHTTELKKKKTKKRENEKTRKRVSAPRLIRRPSLAVDPDPDSPTAWSLVGWPTAPGGSQRRNERGVGGAGGPAAPPTTPLAARWAALGRGLHQLYNRLGRREGLGGRRVGRTKRR